MAKNSELTKSLLAEKARHLKTIELYKYYERLSSNRDFNKLIVEHFFGQYAADMAYAAGDLSLPSEDRGTTSEISRAPGHLRRWFNILKLEYGQALNRIESIEEDLAEEAKLTIDSSSEDEIINDGEI